MSHVFLPMVRRILLLRSRDGAQLQDGVSTSEVLPRARRALQKLLALLSRQRTCWMCALCSISSMLDYRHEMGVLSVQMRAHANVGLVQNGRAFTSRLSVCTAVQWWHVASHTANRGVLSCSCWASLVRVFTAQVIFRRSSSFNTARVDLIF